MGALINIIAIVIYYIFYLFTDKLIRHVFGKGEDIVAESEKLNTLKSIKIKSIEQQKEYIKLKKRVGSDTINNFLISSILIVAYIFVVFPHIETVNQGVISSFIFGIGLAIVAALSINSKYKFFTFLKYANSFIFIINVIVFDKFYGFITIWIPIGLFLLISFILNKLKVV